MIAYNTQKFSRTCSIFNPKPNSITFARKVEYLDRVRSFNNPLLVIIADDINISKFPVLPENIQLYPTKYVDYEFTIIHNKINYGRQPAPDEYMRNVIIHPTAVISEGVNVAISPKGGKVQIKHMGNVFFGEGVEVGALTLVERGVLDSTTIAMGVKIDGRCTIGHNSLIDQDTVIATGAIIGGSAEIGKNCWIGLGAIIRNGISICDNVIVGMAACVTKDITEPGVYAGIPAKLKAPYTPNWNF